MSDTIDRIVEMYYAGRRLASDGKISHMWVMSDTGRSVYFDNKSRKQPPWVVGAPYLHRQTGEHTYILTEDRGDGPTHPDAAEWRLATMEAVRRLEADRMAKRTNTDFDDLTIGEARAMLARTHSSKRGALLVLILDSLRV